ncbi:MAG: hypothetical protein Q9208_008743 [Pyrenodesmia sp. 3 TL-2023]
MPRPSRQLRAPRTSNPPATKLPTPSPLARSHNISASTESSIREAFLHFATSDDDEEAIPGENLSSHSLSSTALKPALKALGITKLTKASLQELLDAADPEDTGTIDYETFVGVAALKLGARDEGDKQGEVDEAFELFLGEGRGEDVITIATLKRVAAVLKEDVDEKVLRDMVLEANGGRGVRAGVGRTEFGEVMRRAGALR